MPHLTSPQPDVKPSSRFAALHVFKLKSGSSSGSASLDTVPPPPPPKDSSLASPSNSLLSPPSVFYNKSFFSRSAASLVTSISPDSHSGPTTPPTPYLPVPSACAEFGKRALPNVNARTRAASPAPSASVGSLGSFSRSGRDHLPSPSMDGSTDSSGSCPNASSNPAGIYPPNGVNPNSCAPGQATATSVKPKKGVFKLASLAKRNRSKKDLSDTASATGSASRSASVSEQEDALGRAEGDEGISLPWNFQHNIHVDEGYIGLPPSWSTALSRVGFDEDEIAAIYARRRAAVNTLTPGSKLANSGTAYLIERPASPRVAFPTTSASSSTTLLEPLPRSTSLGRGQVTLNIRPPSTYSVSTSPGGGPPDTTGGTCPAPSPRAPSFTMRSFVSGIKNSLTSDSASAREGGISKGGGGVTSEESEQYVFVEGDGPGEGGDQGMGNETSIEPYPFDRSSVSSLQSRTSRTQSMSQGQQTPRTPTFPQIQVQRVHSDAGNTPFPSSASRTPSPLAHSSSLPMPSPVRGRTYSNYSTSPSLSHSQSLADASLRPGPVTAAPRTPTRRIYHVANASSDSYDGEKYAEPPPAYVSPKMEEWAARKEKEGLGVLRGPPPPDRPIPSVSTEGVLGVSKHGSREGCQEISVPRNNNDTMGPIDGIPGTPDEVMDISSCYSGNAVHGGDPEMDATQEARSSCPTPPLVIDKRVTKLATLPPRISFHQEGSLEDWSESLFSAIHGKGKKLSTLMRSRGGDTASVEERKTTIRPMSPLSTGGNGHALAAMSGTSSPEAVEPSQSNISSGAVLTLGSHGGGAIEVVKEGDERGHAEEDKVEETECGPENDAGERAVDIDMTTTRGAEVKGSDESPAVLSTPHPPGASLGPNDSFLGKDPDPPALTSFLAPESPCRISIESLPPSPPPKPKPKLTPLAVSPAAVPTLLPRTNVITGLTRKSPVNPLFGATPQPLPIPIPPSQIRAQLRPAPPKPPHPLPTLPLPPLKRTPSQPNLESPSLPQSQLPPVTSPQKALGRDSTAPHASPSDSCPNSSPILLPARANPGDRDSSLSTITVTPVMITTAKTEVVQRAVASVVDPDVVSLASGRESVIPMAGNETLAVVCDEPGTDEESIRIQEHGEAPGDSLVSETSSVSLLRDGSQSKWPAPPPPPVETEMDTTPRRLSRFRTTSLGRVSQLQAIGNTLTSPIGSHFPHGSLEMVSGSTSESMPLTIAKGLNGASPSTASKPRINLAAEARLLTSTTDTFGGVDAGSENRKGGSRSHPPEIYLSGSRASTPPSTHPLLSQLQPYITPRNPASCFAELVEIAEGESGSVFAARIAPSLADAGSSEGQEGMERPIPPGTSHVAIKRIPLPPLASSPSLSDDLPISNKLVSVAHELCLLKDLNHEHLLLLDAVYVDSNSTQDGDTESASALDTSLWIRMELMERSLADVIGLVAEGLALQERLIGRFASDVLHGLDYLQRQHTAHRDVRSDNLLVNAVGVVKLADFSNAICVDRNAPTVSGAVGVIYWQAPEMRAGPYNALKVDIWSLGATVWELAETIPPFSMPASPSTQVSFAVQSARHLGSQWPPLTHPEHYSRAFHEFLRLCGRESAERPGPGELLNTPFIRNACGRAVILQLLSQCRAIEEAMAAKEASASHSQ